MSADQSFQYSNGSTMNILLFLALTILVSSLLGIVNYFIKFKPLFDDLHKHIKTYLKMADDRNT